jgi:hypothetical protein
MEVSRAMATERERRIWDETVTVVMRERGLSEDDMHNREFETRFEENFKEKTEKHHMHGC